MKNSGSYTRVITVVVFYLVVFNEDNPVVFTVVKEKCRICVEDTHTKILEVLKAEVKDNTTLQYFDPQKGITIECDSS